METETAMKNWDQTVYDRSIGPDESEYRNPDAKKRPDIVVVSTTDTEEQQDEVQKGKLVPVTDDDGNVKTKRIGWRPKSESVYRYSERGKGDAHARVTTNANEAIPDVELGDKP